MTDTHNADVAGPRRGRRAAAHDDEHEDEDTGHVTWLHLIVGAVAIALLVAAVIYAVVQARTPDTNVTVTLDPSQEPFDLELPAQVGDYTKLPGSSDDPTEGDDGSETLSATYTKDSLPAVIVLLHRPQLDARKFMEEAAYGALTEVSNGLCGVSTDVQLNGCVVIREETAILVTEMAGQSRTELMEVADEFAEELTKG